MISGGGHATDREAAHERTFNEPVVSTGALLQPAGAAAYAAPALIIIAMLVFSALGRVRRTKAR